MLGPGWGGRGAGCGTKRPAGCERPCCAAPPHTAQCTPPEYHPHPHPHTQPLAHPPAPPQGRWVIFNDEKVAASQEPPLDRGYLYLYRRVGPAPAQ